jgi:hypothetical protein
MPSSARDPLVALLRSVSAEANPNFHREFSHVQINP